MSWLSPHVCRRLSGGGVRRRRHSVGAPRRRHIRASHGYRHARRLGGTGGLAAQVWVSGARHELARCLHDPPRRPQISALPRKLGVVDRAALVEVGAVFGRVARIGTALPVPLISFVGRERETDEIAALLQGHRLLTLTGPAGAGKTRL